MLTERERALQWMVQAMVMWHQAQIIPEEHKVAFLSEGFRKSIVEFSVHFGELRPMIDLINDELYKELCNLRLRAQLRGGNMTEDEVHNLVVSIVERYSTTSSTPSSSTAHLQ